MSVDSESKRKIIDLLSVLFPDAKIYLFGSRARGEQRKLSDIDLAIDAGQALEPRFIEEARAVLLASDVPYPIDVVDYHSVSKNMRAFIDQEKILWKS